MGASRSAGTWLAVLAGVTVVGVGWAFFALALTTDVFSSDRADDRAIVVSASPSGDGNAVATIDVVALDEHLAAVDERIAALEDAQVDSPEVVSSGGDSPSITVDGVALDEHLAAVDERVAALDSRIAALDERVAALEDVVESVSQSSPTQGVPLHDHVTSPVSTFPHVWTGTGNTLPEEFLHVRMTEGWWHFELEAACLGDLSSCPRPGDNPPVLLVRDLDEDPFGNPDWIESGTEWCEDFEATREFDWRLWMTNVRGVTWSLTIGGGQCPQPGE